MALENRTVIRKGEMVGTADREKKPIIRGESLVDRLDVSFHLKAFRVSVMNVLAYDKHERPRHSLLNDAAKWHAVHVDSGRAPGILLAKLSGLGSPKRMAERAHVR